VRMSTPREMSWAKARKTSAVNPLRSGQPKQIELVHAPSV
jgi:hypothetical protein